MFESMFDAAGHALLLILDPSRLAVLSAGVLMGLGLGIIPGIGGLVGMSLLLPFTFTMDPVTAFALLLGMWAVTGTSDTIPAVLFGVPGTSSAQATVMDGNPMAKNGEAGRALSAAYTASLIGGLFGALLLALFIPLIRPFILYIGSPELLAVSIFGISMVAVLSGQGPLRGLAMAGFGALLAMVGGDPQTGTYRWTMDVLYLWDGLPLVPVTLGLFALPELADMAIKRVSVARSSKFDARAGMMRGMRDALQNWSLVLRCGGLGALVGAIPGLGSSVVDWLAYGHALQTVKGADKTFGKGDVRGVIAPESANNSITSGALIPTVAFGVPGSASMAILLGAFIVHGLIPGPEMLTRHLDVTYSMIWSVAIANILGAGICFLFSGQLAKLALLRYTIILPLVLLIVVVGSFQATRNWGDLYALLIFGVLGWTMKRLRWARAPLVLGFVLGALIERYMFISVDRFGISWMGRPAVAVLLILALVTFLRPLLREVRQQGGLGRTVSAVGRPRFGIADLFQLALIAVVALMMVEAVSWPFAARIAPEIVGTLTIATAGISLVCQVLRRGALARGGAPEDQRMHMDVATDMSDLEPRVFVTRSCTFFGWLAALMISVALIGMIPTIPLFIVAYMRIEGREAWTLALVEAVAFTCFVYILFDQYMTLPWPPTLLGSWFPALRFIPSL